MKHPITYAVALLSITVCGTQKNELLNDSAIVSISPAESVVIGKADLPDNQERLTALEVVKQAEQTTCRQPRQEYPPSRGINDESRDFKNVRIRMYSSDIIDQSTSDLPECLITAEDFMFATIDERNEILDNIAYVPNSVLHEVAVKIRAAYSAEDYQACYDLFENAYTFVPITGAEWRELKARDEN